MNILEVDDLTVSFRTTRGKVKAVEGFSFHVQSGETVAIVGESGCGKSTTALSILRLVPEPPGSVDGGRILFGDSDLLSLSSREMQRIRGNRIAMIFQDPMMALNPVHTVGRQIGEMLIRHKRAGREEAAARAIELMRLVGIPAPEERVRQYPHNLSGGMRQRVMIAMALACDPELIIADEPTTALDVTIQAQILDLLQSLQDRLGMAVLLITHDLGVVSEIADRVVVMYAGRKIEEGVVSEVFAKPAHPYTVGLLAAAQYSTVAARTLVEIPGTVPDPMDMPQGCRFAPRCPHVMPVCRTAEPAFRSLSSVQSAACFLTAG